MSESESSKSMLRIAFCNQCCELTYHEVRNAFPFLAFTCKQCNIKTKHNSKFALLEYS